jgi:hypothetical protein
MYQDIGDTSLAQLIRSVSENLFLSTRTNSFGLTFTL